MNKIRTVFTLLLIASILTFFTPLYTYAGNGDVIVHVTKSGSKYHSAGCSYLKSDISMTLKEAIDKGYTRCSRCNPPKYEPDTAVSSTSSLSGAPYANSSIERTEVLSEVSQINGYDRNSKEIKDYQGIQKVSTNSEKEEFMPREFLDIGFWYEDEFDFLLIIIGLQCIIIFQNCYYRRKDK